MDNILDITYYMRYREGLKATVEESLCAECPNTCVTDEDFEACDKFQDELYRMTNEGHPCACGCGRPARRFGVYSRGCGEKAYGGKR